VNSGVTEKFLADKNPEKINLGVVSALVLPTVCDCHWEWSVCLPACLPGVSAGVIFLVSLLCADLDHLQGAYRDDRGQPVVLASVRQAEQQVAGSHFME
jgi:hypothetical protein